MRVNAGLRIDVDTYRGTKLGVPALCDILESRGIHASFFFSVGPDNMGRHLWRLLRPKFLLKMLRTNAAGLYGWDILLRGTVIPGPIIGQKLGRVIRHAADAGHEIGLHAWDHHAWQSRISTMTGAQIRETLSRGFDLLAKVIGHPPTCSAAPAWRCTDQDLLEKLSWPLEYNSDCRGDSIFQPIAAGQALAQPQIPTTLPTYDEAIGREGVSANNYNDFLLDQIRPDQLNTLTVHAEVEGIRCRELFQDFLEKARKRNLSFVPLGQLLKNQALPLPRSEIIAGSVPGREGWIACQATSARSCSHAG